ncbi:MAG: 23S rRNA (guanosine(2251)-2'-O)-methyltransferase RlmB [Anaerolineales bacterium]|nr:23S rRNA (guanosine(2251)-2'-O)-methyltransferase RlmB [Anaerolineales bacterium]
MQQETLYGRHPVRESLVARRRVIHEVLIAEGAERKGVLAEIINEAESFQVPVRVVPRQYLDQYEQHHQGVLAQAEPYPYVTLHDILDFVESSVEPALILILDVIQNPQNLGTLLRTAEAVGVHGVLIPKRRGVEVTPSVVRASAGASEYLMVAKDNLARAITQLKERGLWIAGLENQPEAKRFDEFDLTEPLGLVVGGEGEGMRHLTKQSCDLILSLPMGGHLSSLNAAVAGSIVLYEVWRAREGTN